ncbi:MAG: peptidase [Roseovarius sp.]|nr:peptidase [Roseovarius sp.]
MTYCVGLALGTGLVFMSDTRTNAGVDNVSTFRKMTVWEVPGTLCLTLLSSGNLATTQAVISQLEERGKAPGERDPGILSAPSMFQAARIVAETLRDVVATHESGGMTADASFQATLILGGQIKGGPPQMFLIYPEGNFIETSEDTPFFQIGETKYGKPILVRAYDRSLGFADAMRLLLVSFDSTVKANLSVAPPFDYHFYATDSLCVGRTGRIQADDPYYIHISEAWGQALKDALGSLPEYGGGEG